MKLIAAAILIAGGTLAVALATERTDVGQLDVQSVGLTVLAVGGVVFLIEYFRSWKSRGD